MVREAIIKIVGAMALHYGVPYIGAAIQSVIDAIDQMVVLYSPTPSHNGGRASLPCPDTEAQLYAIAKTVAGNKLVWVKGNWRYEYEQRGAIWEYAPDADVVLIVDSDECYGDGLAQEAIEYALQSPAKSIRLPFAHFWRSFKRGFLHDPAYPERVINIGKTGETVTMPTDRRIWHGGYALPVRYIAYKTSGIHGHQSQFRRDVNWLQDVYIANRQYDCHPIGSEWWNCEDITPELLPSVLKYHPFAKMDIIE